MKFKKLAVLSASVFALAATAQAEVIVNEMNEIPFGAFIECADGGNGEVALGSIRLHVLVRENFDDAGGAHFGVLFHPMGGTLTGLVTGDTYNATGRTGDTFNVAAGGLPITSSFVNQFNLVGTAGGVKFTVHETIHFTVNANGEVTAEVVNAFTTCQ